MVALTWTLKDTLGDELDVLDAPVEFLVGGDDLLKRIEEALQGHTVGDTLQLHLEPEDAFGDYVDTLIFLEQRTLFPKELEEGMTFEGSALPPGCNAAAPKDALYTVTDIYPEHVVLDGNHPWLVLPCALRSRWKPCAKPRKKKLAAAVRVRAFSASPRPPPPATPPFTKKR